MSSDYRALCLSHSPGLEIDVPTAQSHAVLEEWLRPITRPHKFGEHQRCDLVGGRFSTPLIEVYCPGNTLVGDVRDGVRCTHADGWVPLPALYAMADLHALDDEVNRTTSVAQDERRAAVRTALESVRSVVGVCWTPERLRRVLGMAGVAYR